MYAHFYQLAENPFNLTPDPKFHYINESTREAMAAILHGINSRKGFVALVGEAGTGKTTLLKRIVDEIEGETLVVFVFNPGVSFDELLEFICTELGIPTDSRRRLSLLDRLNDFLLDQLTAGRNVVVMIDEAQTLDGTVLEELRLLSNLETSKEKILQILLSGQPELDDKLRRPELRQLRQRIAVRATLKPMRASEIGSYVETRLRSAGADRNDFFTPAALRKIWHASKGIPRVINVICDNAMMIAFADGKRRISGSIIAEAVRDLHGGYPRAAFTDRLRAVVARPVVRNAAAVLVTLALVLPLAASLVDGRKPADPIAATTAPVEVAPIKAVPVTSPQAAVTDARAAVDRTRFGQHERATLERPRPTPERRAAAPVAPKTTPLAPPVPSAVVAGARTRDNAQPAQPVSVEQGGAHVTASSPRVADDVVSQTIRRAEVLARSTAARLFNGKAETLEESVAREMAGGEALIVENEPQSVIDAARIAERMPTEIERIAVASAAGARREPVVPAARASRDERAAAKKDVGATTSAAEPRGAVESLAGALDTLARVAQPIASSGPRGSEAQSRGRVLGPREGEPLVGRLVRVLPGDTVWDIAVANYGTAGPVTLKRILNSNPRIRDPRHIEVGAHIYLPFQRPDQMVRILENGGYAVVVSISPQEARLDAVRQWLREAVANVDLTTTRVGGTQVMYQLQVVHLGSRESALSIASDILAEYGRTRHRSSLGG